SQGRIYQLSPNAGSFPDADGDHADDACDCAPMDRNAFSTPVEVPHLRVAWPWSAATGTATALAWDLQIGTAGRGTRKTIVRGYLDALRYPHDYSHACALATNLNFPPFADTRPDPPPGSGYYYLVQASNACGAGTFGDGNPGVGGGVDP